MAASPAPTATAFTAAGVFRTSITAPIRPADAPHATADVPEVSGGTDDGPSPVQLFLGSLAACKTMTARSYANRKGWDLRDLRVTVVWDADAEGGPVLRATAEFEGELTDEQRDKLLAIMERCHVQQMIAAAPRVETTIAANA